jgi:hypothetical protein
MRSVRTAFSPLGLLVFLASLGGPVLAADLPRPAPVVSEPMAAPSGWTFNFVPYGWLPAMKGTLTVRGRSVKVDASFIDILEESDSLVALMGDFEARNGRWSLFSDVVWSNIGADRSNLRTRAVAPGVTATVGTALDLDIDMAIVEVGAAYEVARSGPVAFDILAGARYWYQEGDLSFGLAGTIGLEDLELGAGRAIARSRSVDWLDPLVGVRMRYTLAPGHQLLLRGDIGGFGVGSEFSWQAIGAYAFDFGVYNGITFSGVVGYRALFVDYAQGFDRTRYEFDMLQHGPILGVSMRF